MSSKERKLKRERENIQGENLTFQEFDLLESYSSTLTLQTKGP